MCDFLTARIPHGVYTTVATTTVTAIAVATVANAITAAPLGRWLAGIYRGKVPIDQRRRLRREPALPEHI